MDGHRSRFRHRGLWEQQQRVIDRIIIEATSLPSAFLDELDNFITSVVLAMPSIEAPTDVLEEVLCSMKKSIPIVTDPKELSKVTKEEWREYTKDCLADCKYVPTTSIPPSFSRLKSQLDSRSYSASTARLFWTRLPARGPRQKRPFHLAGTSSASIRTRFISRHHPQGMRSLKNGHGPEFTALDAAHGDSRGGKFVKDDTVGLVVTSPPYWNKADYGNGQTTLEHNRPLIPHSSKPLAAFGRDSYRHSSRGASYAL